MKYMDNDWWLRGRIAELEEELSEPEPKAVRGDPGDLLKEWEADIKRAGLKIEKIRRPRRVVHNSQSDCETPGAITVETIKPNFSKATLAKFLAIPENTVNKWLQQRRLPPYDFPLGNRCKRWYYQTIIKAIEGGELLK